MSVSAPLLMDPGERAAFRAAVAEGLAETNAGLFIPFEDVARWLEFWGSDDELPPPA